MNHIKKQKNRYITGYDGLRTFGVLGVILYHLNPNVFVGGYLGVPIFFAVSGYLVTDHMLASYQQTGHYDNKGYLLRRIKKIYPQLLTVLLASSAYIFMFQRDLLAKLYQIFISNVLNVYNWWQIANGQSYFERFAGHESPFTHLWTLSIEGQFYLIWPLIIFLLVRYVKKPGRMFGIMLGVSVLSAALMAFLYQPGVDTSRIYYGTDTRLFAILLGGALAVIWPSTQLRTHIAKSDRRLLNTIGAVAALGMLFLIFSPMMDPQKALTYRGGMFIFSILTVILIAIVAHPGADFNRYLTNPIFKWVGQRSYGIYLYQFPVMIFFENKVKVNPSNQIIAQIIEVLIILVVSDLAYRLIERPLGKVTWSKTRRYIKNIFDFHSPKIFRKVGFVFAVLIILVGASAIIVSPTVKAADPNDSPLAKQIAKNKAEDKKRNSALIRQAKEAKKKKINKSDLYREAEQNAKEKPINREFEPYGISQLQLQLAQKLPVTAIGDSVMAGSSNNLKVIFPQMIVDASVSRQLVNSFDLVNSYKQKGALNDTVLIALGTNGPFTSDDMAHMMQIIGPSRRVFWINTKVPRQWQGDVNELLTESAAKYRNLTVIDWYKYSVSHQDWFYDDQTHPSPDGSKYYTAFIAKEIIKNTKF
ncbi:hypothetical protein FC62_GL000266 [Amylolactobacillus amylotrophicus DSM 20534]|uniref:Uncharacterized protein n=3 Tax=Amylolactobacillus TaxID=2767876 RepID=A0A0R1YKT6_9LACO|nr:MULTISPECIES: acyltransferase family protein [Amylolactobacillus]APT19150.1 acetyltransferase [Amylolactobacillus amylophilus DSM 20533 = JCM 1125]KRK38579.1 hypothetical protein FC62_GL000266 [Amylolactobacillus amylotrophicus DSM 20534]KRM42778.1 hypothetical protein FD40_GL000573 [Amylolactobacillus amylophilus DSM 20533 = JCM 1125]GED79641.1 acyltransferase [Amylolactobacillus amylophilus]